VTQYTIQRSDCNKLANAHGGHIASLFDLVTSMPLTLINKPGFWFWLGVSRTLNVTYLKPIPLGEEILVEAEILSIGKKLTTIRGTMRRESDGALLTVCEHGKVNTDPEASSKI
jgi:acyl-coenzyme A thioesterase PaaI-like protein